MNVRVFLLWVGLWAVFYSGQAQSAWRYERLSTNSGLSQNTINKIIQDRWGFLWFATSDGLNRYDGYGFQILRHDPSDPNTLSGSDISSVTEDEEGNLWVGTRIAGLNKIERKTGKVYRISKGIKGRDISGYSVPSILKLSKHRIAASFIGYGVLVFDTKTNALLEEDSDISTPNIKEVVRLYRSAKGGVWMGTQNGQLLFGQAGRSPIPFKIQVGNRLVQARVRVLYEISNGDILVGTEGEGLFRFDFDTQAITRVFYMADNPSSRSNNITSMVRDHKGDLWLGTDNGVYVFQGERFDQYRYIPSNPDPDLGISAYAVTSVFQDANQNMWIGTWEAGLNIQFAQKPRFSVMRYKPNSFSGLLTNKVATLACNDDRGVWVGTNVGLSYVNFKTNQIEHVVNNATINRLKSENNFDVNLMYAEPKGSLWVGVWQKGLVEITAQRKRIEYPYPLPSYEANLSALYRDGNRFLLGTSGRGLLAFDLKSKTYYQPYPILNQSLFQSKGISQILRDAKGRIWVGTTSIGLFIYDPLSGKLLHFDRSNGLKYNHVTALFKDHRGVVWVGTNGGGLHEYLGYGFKVWTINDGLASNTIRAMEEDRKGFLWISTNGGISKMDLKSRNIVNFDESDGLQGKEFLVNAHAQNAQGWLFFGGVNGLNYIKSDSLRMKLEVPEVRLTELRIFNRTVRPGDPDGPLSSDISFSKNLILEPHQTVFSLDFVALEYQRPKNNRYAYYLEGFESDWNYVGNQRSVTYTNLSPGDYVFKVKASNSDGVWSDKPFELYITVLPPWYKTWWAYTLYALVLAAMVYGSWREIRLRERFRTDLRLKEIEKERIQELEQVKTHFFTNISHELRTPLTLIISPLERYFLQGNGLSKDQKSRMEGVYANAKKLLHLINQLLDLSKIESGKQAPRITQNDLSAQVEQILQGFEAYASQKNIQLKWHLPAKSLMLHYDGDVLEKCLSNLLSNAFKHTPEEGKIGVQVLTLESEGEIQRIQIKVMDTGKGISAEHLPHIFNRFYQIPDKLSIAGTGVGLSLCKELMELHLGHIQVDSTPGKGSTFTLDFPVHLSAFDPEWVQGVWAPVLQDVRPKLEKSSKEIPAEQQLLLIVEDHPQMRAFVSDIFSGSFHVLEAERGEDALEMAQQYLPDVIITDWMMPGMSGLNLCKALRQNPKTNHIPVLILTSKSSQESQIEGMQAGADDFISKPFHADLLQLRVNKLLETKERLRQSTLQQLLQDSEEPRTISMDPLLQRATDLVLAHLSDAEFDVEDLERGLDMSKMQLYRKLKNLTSMAGNEFIRSIRLREAKHLLEQGELNVSEVAYRVGFNDPAYFTRMFKKQYGSSPRVMRG